VDDNTNAPEALFSVALDSILTVYSFPRESK